MLCNKNKDKNELGFLMTNRKSAVNNKKKLEKSSLCLFSRRKKNLENPQKLKAKKNL